jgi:16S rRNA (uracil1498-N3)-methyltransferase
MRRRFFVDQVHSGKAEIQGEEARHLTRVLRVEPGQRYEISDNRSVYLAEIETARKEHVVFRTLEKIDSAPPGIEVTLCAALVKFDHFEWMIEKATELGVTGIIPVEAVRTEKGLMLAAQKRVERWRRIALEASQQARRAHLPQIAEPVKLAALLAERKNGNRQSFALDEAGGTPLKEAMQKVPGSSPEVSLLVGPEGGWTDEERAAFLVAGWTRISLGPLILRAETAALAALAVIQAEWLVH